MQSLPSDAVLACCFAPLATPAAHTLILGSVPGQASLAAQRYYAHPRNAFWPIVCDVLAVPRDAPYEVRCEALLQAGWALWDVLACCERPGSLDANIRPTGRQVNDFTGFFAEHPAIDRVFFNGATAESLFHRHAMPQLGHQCAAWHIERLPSTSPAHAALGQEAKLARWRSALSRGASLPWAGSQ